MRTERILKLKPRLMPHQVDFVMDDFTPIQGFVGGYRAGKSEALTWKSLRCATELFPGEHGVIISPIAGMNQRNIVPILRRIMPTTGLEYDVEGLANKRVDHLDIKVGNKISRIWLGVSAENYTRMNGMSLAWGGFDEADLCRNAETAYDAFVELGNRLSEAENALQFAVSTPEGFNNFMYRRFVEERNVEWLMKERGMTKEEAEAAAAKVKIWHVKMTDNFLLPKGYLASRLANIPANKQSAYVNGEFANIFTKTVYECFDRVENHTDMTDMTNPHAPIHIGMDFNVEHCAAIAHVIDQNGDPHAVHEFIDLFNTEKMCQAIKAKYGTRRVIVYPDASGKNRNAAGLSTSHAIIRQYGFEIKVPNQNPGVWKDRPNDEGNRVNTMNAMFKAANGKRRYKVNTRLCPTYTRCLERQGWKDGEPDKSNNVDHPLDAGGYFIHFNYNLQGRPSVRQHG